MSKVNVNKVKAGGDVELKEKVFGESACYAWHDPSRSISERRCC